MSPLNVDLEAWQAIGGAAAIVAVAIENRLSQRKTRKVAEKAVELSAPTGNGFAKKVTDSLKRIEDAQVRTEKKIDDHIAVHADADVLSHPRRIKRELTEL